MGAGVASDDITFLSFFLSLSLPPSSYMVSVSLVDRLSECFSSITGPIEQPAITQLVLGGLNLLVATTAFLHLRLEFVVFFCFFLPVENTPDIF